MAYATLDDLTARFGAREIVDLSDRDNDDVADADVVAAAIADAEGLADSYLGRRYPLPLSETPAALKNAVCDIARRGLWKQGVPEGVDAAADRAIAWLRDVAAGRADLPLGSGDPGAATETAGPSIAVDDPVFSRTTLEGY